jgi:hypothetical protein
MKLFKALVGLAAAASVIPLKVEKVEEDGKKTVRISSLTWKAEYTSATPEEEAILNVDLVGGMKEIIKKKEKPAEEAVEEIVDSDEITLPAEAEKIEEAIVAPEYDLADRISDGGIRWAELDSENESAQTEESEEETESLSDEELKSIAHHLGELMYDADDLLCDAVETVVALGKASTSLIQRKFAVGYGRAVKMIDTMYKSKIVSGHNGSKPRDVLITVEQWNKIKVQIGKTTPATEIPAETESVTDTEQETV